MTSLRAGLLLSGLLLTACGTGTGPVAAPPSPPSSAPSPSPSPSPEVPDVRLTGDGVELPDGLVPFGEPYDAVAPRLVAALGEPTLDTGETDSFSAYGTCPGSRLRALELGGGDLVLLFGDVIGPDLTLYQWRLRGAGDVPRASALVGDVTTFEFGVGTTLGELRAGTATDTLAVQPADDPLPASFRLADQSAGFFGTLTDATDAGTVTSVQAGEGCGE